MIGPISEYQLREVLLAPCRRIVRRLSNRDVFQLGCEIMDALDNWRDRQADASGVIVIERIDPAHPARLPALERRRASDVETFECAGIGVQNDVDLVLLLIENDDPGIRRVIGRWGPHVVLAMVAMMSPEADVVTLGRLVASFTNVFFEGKLRADKGDSDRRRGQRTSKTSRMAAKEQDQAIFRAEAKKRLAERPQLMKSLVLDLMVNPPTGQHKRGRRWIEGAVAGLHKELPSPKP